MSLILIVQLSPDSCFFKKNWGVIKNDLLAMFRDFFCGSLDLYRQFCFDYNYFKGEGC
jgi:hypothetical protein